MWLHYVQDIHKQQKILHSCHVDSTVTEHWVECRSSFLRCHLFCITDNYDEVEDNDFVCPKINTSIGKKSPDKYTSKKEFTVYKLESLPEVSILPFLPQ